MAAEAWDRDMIFANFQAASGIEDYERCISILEINNWDLQDSVNAVLLEQENENRRLNRISNQRYSPINVDNPSFIDLDPDPLPSVQRDGGAPEIQKINFQILWHDRTLPVTINEHEKVGALKRMLEIQTGIPQNELNLEGWPSGESHVTDMTQLSSLKLGGQTHLALHTPTKVTVSPAEYLPCNIPACRSRKNSKSSEPDSPPRVIDVDLNEDRPSCSNIQEISLTVNHLARDYRLRYKKNQIVKEVKQELFMLTKIATRHQTWEGWPEGTTDKSRLGDLDLSQPDHFLLLLSQPTTSLSRTNSDSQRPWDSGMAGSPADTDLEEQLISDEEDDAMFDSEANQSKRLLPLLPRDSADTSESLIRFQFQFEERYGEFHPVFFVGPLKDAIEEAAGSSASEGRPLLVYLHHDNSILTNIFCSQILCSEQFVSFVSQNFVIWPWDMTYESNRQRFVNLLVQHFGNMTANTVSKFRDQEYPLLLIVMKSKAGVEVCSVLQANTSLDELMMSLINGFEVFEQTKIVEVKAERERLEREAMKQEQDDAYHQSLAADRAKVEAERERVQREVDKKHQDEMDAQLKEAERISCEEQLPGEPPKTEKNTTNILFRFPDGDREARRFRNSDKLKIVFMYVASKGYGIQEHQIVTNFPRRQLTEDSIHKTLKELKLCPQGTLFVEEL